MSVFESDAAWDGAFGIGSEMKCSYRKATLDDVPAMYELRRNSILQLAPKAMSVEQSVKWASRLTLEAMFSRLASAQFWLAESSGSIAGWVGVRTDEIYGIYVHPDYASQGVGSGLLRLAETMMLAAGVTTARLDASWNAEDFYLRSGYRPTGPRPADDTRVFVKSLRSAPIFGRRKHPTVVMLAGLPGAGKTSLAYAIAQVLPFVVLDKDRINAILLHTHFCQSSVGPLSYDVLLDLAEDMVANQGHSVILDTAGRQPIIFDRARFITQCAGAALRVIHLKAPFEIRQNRLSSREARPSQWVADQTTDAEEAEWYSHLPPDTLVMSSLRPVKEYLPDVLAFLLSEHVEIQGEEPG